MAATRFSVVLLDIEGTVCPISFVKDVLFPYALQALPSTLSAKWDDESFKPYREAFPEEYRKSPSALESHVRDLMSQDKKISYLKNLQGHLWLEGYKSGALKCPLFTDVAPAMNTWHRKGTPIIIYSSGSVAAQKLLFQYTDVKTDAQPEGDLRPLISDYFDTINAGLKTETSSYTTIAKAHDKWPVGEWLFLSDNPKEVKAAKEAGMQSFIVERDGNAPLTEEERKENTVITSFEGLA